MPNARNPKVARFTVSLEEDINTRLERIADKLGQNKASTAAMLMAVGLNIFEPVLQIGNEPYVDQAVEDRRAKMLSDMKSAS